MPLEDNYVGDEVFANFASCDDPRVAGIGTWVGWNDLVSACNGDPLLARALVLVCGEEHALSWLDQHPPVLEGMSGRECLRSPAGLARLKQALITFPFL